MPPMSALPSVDRDEYDIEKKYPPKHCPATPQYTKPILKHLG